MKTKLRVNLILLVSLFVAVAIQNITAQEWNYKVGENAFDGKYKSCSIQGVGYEFPYTDPIFVINVFKGNIEDPNIYLAKVPSGVCEHNNVIIKFDSDDKSIYEPGVSISNDNETWFLRFFTFTYDTIEDFRKEYETKYVLNVTQYSVPSDSRPIKFKSQPEPNSPAIKELVPNDTFEVLEFDQISKYWKCRYNNEIGYINDVYLTEFVKKPKEVTKEIFIPTKKLMPTSQRSNIKEFVADLKSHTVMNIRITSDCVHSDFKFSLKGSTNALNFVFSK